MSVQISSIIQIASSSAQTDSLRASFASMTQATPSAAADRAAPAATGAQPTAQDLQQAADTLNQHFAGIRDDIRFSVAHDLGMPVISVVNANTGEVVWQMPSEQALEAARQASGSGHILQVKA